MSSLQPTRGNAKRVLVKKFTENVDYTISITHLKVADEISVENVQYSFENVAYQSAEAAYQSAKVVKFGWSRPKQRNHFIDGRLFQTILFPSRNPESERNSHVLRKMSCTSTTETCRVSVNRSQPPWQRLYTPCCTIPNHYHHYHHVTGCKHRLYERSCQQRDCIEG